MKYHSSKPVKHPQSVLTCTRWITHVGIIVAAVALSLDSAPACTDFYLTNAGPYRISARTMDMESGQVGYKSWALVVYPRDHQYESHAPNKQPGLKWTSRYGFVGVTSTDTKGVSSPHDGLNEEGLGVAMNWLIGTEFSQPKSDESALEIKDVALWILSNFTTCDEASAGLKNVTVWSKDASKAAFHLAIHDATGKSLAIEWTDGKMNIYDNTAVAILTNEPELPFYLEQIKYLEWQKTLALPAIAVPGAWYPIDRFVRAYTVRKGLPTPKSNSEAVTQAVHILNSVQTPWGAPGTDSEKPALLDNFDHTTWSVIRDHKNRVLYFRTVLDQQLHSVDLKNLDLTQRSVLSLGIEKSTPINAIDVTSDFTPSKQS